MSGVKFLITLVVIYLIFRSVMRKVLSALNSDGGSAMKGKLGDVIEQMKREVEKARLEAERQAAGTTDEMIISENPWAEMTEGEQAHPVRKSQPLREERPTEATPAPAASHERWDTVDETPSLWDRAEMESVETAPSRWDLPEEEAVDLTPSLWDRSDDEEELPLAARAPMPPVKGTCRTRRKMRIHLKEAVIWKEILDRPVGLRS